MALDSIDARILEILQENARVSISELSKRINLSLSAVSERLKKLEQSGVITEYTAVLDPKIMNRSLQLSLRVKTDGSASDASLLKLVGECDEILSCIQVAGSCDYLLTAATEDTETLSELINRLKALKGVTDIDSDIFLKVIKQKHSVPPTYEK